MEQEYKNWKITSVVTTVNQQGYAGVTLNEERGGRITYRTDNTDAMPSITELGLSADRSGFLLNGKRLEWGKAYPVQWVATVRVDTIGGRRVLWLIKVGVAK